MCWKKRRKLLPIPVSSVFLPSRFALSVWSFLNSAHLYKHDLALYDFFKNKGNIEGINSSNMFVLCLCIYVWMFCLIFVYGLTLYI